MVEVLAAVIQDPNRVGIWLRKQQRQDSRTAGPAGLHLPIERLLGDGSGHELDGQTLAFLVDPSPGSKRFSSQRVTSKTQRPHDRPSTGACATVPIGVVPGCCRPHSPELSGAAGRCREGVVGLEWRTPKRGAAD